MMDLWLHKMLTDGLEWCGSLVDYCDVFISCLDSHSDGTHSLQSIHCWDSDVMLHFSKSDEETNSSTSRMAWGWVKFHQMFIFEWTIPWNSELRLNNFSKTVSGWTQRPASKKREGMNGHKHERMCVWGFSVDRWASVCRRGVNERYIGGTRLTSPQPGVTLITAISYSAISLSLSLSPPEAHMSTHTHTHLDVLLVHRDTLLCICHTYAWSIPELSLD